MICRNTMLAMCLMAGPQLVLSAGLSSGTGAGPTDLQLTLSAGTLTLTTADTPLSEVLQAVAAQAGFRLIVRADLHRAVTVNMRSMPVARAIQRLLQGTPSLLRWDASGELLEVLVPAAASSTGAYAAEPPGLPEPNTEEGTTEEPTAAAPTEVAPEAVPAATEAQQTIPEQGGSQEAEPVPALAVSDLMERLRHDNPAVRQTAATELGRLQGPEFLSALAEALASEDSTVRLRAVLAIARSNSGESVALLGSAVLNDPDPEVRRLATLRLGQLADSEVLTVLQTAAADPDEKVAETARSALQRRGY